METSKKWWQSKTVWFNVITILIGVIGQITDVFTFDAQTAKIFATVLGVGNIILRFLTTGSINTKKE